MFKDEFKNFLTQTGIKFEVYDDIEETDDIDAARKWPLQYTSLSIDGGVEFWFNPIDDEYMGMFTESPWDFKWKSM